MARPKFSIVIALAPWRDAEILPYIERQDFPKGEYEIIIKKGTNVPTNRNAGIKDAKGEIILFLDDDAVIEPDFLKKVDKFFSDYPEVSVLGGPQLTPSSDKFFAKLSGYALADPFASPGLNKRYKKTKLSLNADSSYITGALMIVRREVFEKLRFDPKIYPADDVTFVDTAKKLGFKVAASPDIYIYHRRRADLRGLVEQIYGYGKARPKLGLSGIKSVLFWVPTLFLTYLVLLVPLMFLSLWFVVPLIAYISLSLIFSLYEAAKNRDILSFFILPLIFLMVHLSYGVGFLIGVLKR